MMIKDEFMKCPKIPHISFIVLSGLLGFAGNAVALTSQTLSQTPIAAIYPSATITPSPTTTGTSTTTPITWTGSGGCSGSGSRTVDSTNTGPITSNTLAMNASPTNLCVLTFNRATDAVYSSATKVSYIKVKQDITITTDAPVTAAASTTFPVAATATSGLTVSIAVTGGCSISSGVVTMTGASETCTVSFNQAGNTVYASATAISRVVTLPTITRQVKYLWIDGNTGFFRVSTTVAPTNRVACMSAFGYFLSNDTTILATLVDAKLNNNYVDISYTPRPTTNACAGTEDQLATLTNVSISNLAPSPVTPAPVSGSTNGIHTMSTGVFSWFVVNGMDGIARLVPSSTLSPHDYCDGFRFDTTTVIGKKFFSLMAAARTKDKTGVSAPVTVWYPVLSTCPGGDSSLAPINHVGLMY